MKVCWISGGVSSFVAGWLVRNTIDKWIYIDVADQHPDTMRYIHDCGGLLGVPIEVLRSDKYKNVEDVVRRQRYINGPHGAPCTGLLKKAVRAQWEQEQYRAGVVDLCYVWGMDAAERRRAESIRQNFPEFGHEFPLLSRGLSKEDCHGIARELGLKRPAMYDLGYQNNNCIGCVKGGMWYWNKIRRDFPDVFSARAALEREIGASCIKGVYLDELDPGAGRKADEISEDCSLICYMFKSESE